MTRVRVRMIVAAMKGNLPGVGDFLEHGAEQRGFPRAIETDKGRDFAMRQLRQSPGE